MSVPQLNRKLILEAPIRQPDGAGGFTVVWTALGTLWAEVTPRSGTERAGIAAPLSRARYRIVIRGAAPGLPRRPAPEQRFREGARLFHILAVTEADKAARYLACDAQEEIVS